MKSTAKLFVMGLRQVLRDSMLFALLPAPFLAGALFRFGLPPLSAWTEQAFGLSLMPWYGLADALLACLSPMLVAIIAAFLILEERDEGVTGFYQVSPMTGPAFLLARLGLPMVWGFASTLLALGLFALSGPSGGTVLAAALASTLAGLVTAMLVVCFAQNRVEGLAVSKLLGLTYLGLVFVWFVPAPYARFAAFLPSYWIGIIIRQGAYWGNVFPAVFVGGAWLALFLRRFLRQAG